MSLDLEKQLCFVRQVPGPHLETFAVLSNLFTVWSISPQPHQRRNTYDLRSFDSSNKSTSGIVLCISLCSFNALIMIGHKQPNNNSTPIMAVDP
jgi:hypothetical protein